MVEHEAQRERVVGVDQKGELLVALRMLEGGRRQRADIGIEFGRRLLQPRVVDEAVAVHVGPQQGVEARVVEGG